MLKFYICLVNCLFVVICALSTFQLPNVNGYVVLSSNRFICGGNSRLLIQSTNGSPPDTPSESPSRVMRNLIRKARLVWRQTGGLVNKYVSERSIHQREIGFIRNVPACMDYFSTPNDDGDFQSDFATLRQVLGVLNAMQNEETDDYILKIEELKFKVQSLMCELYIATMTSELSTGVTPITVSLCTFSSTAERYTMNLLLLTRIQNLANAYRQKYQTQMRNQQLL